jgi:hypothetical protein
MLHHNVFIDGGMRPIYTRPLHIKVRKCSVALVAKVWVDFKLAENQLFTQTLYFYYFVQQHSLKPVLKLINGALTPEKV